MYVDRVIRKYKDPVIVFDNYPEHPLIKDETYLHRTNDIISPNVNAFQNLKWTFLLNSHNK